MANGVDFVTLSTLEGESHIGNASTHIAASSNLIFTDLSSFKRPAFLQLPYGQAGLYQGITQAIIKRLHATNTFEDFFSNLILVADQAYAFRKLEIVGRIGDLLSNYPFSGKAKLVGHYYQALYIQNRGRGDLKQSARMLERVAENAPPNYKARALLALGANFRRQGDHQTALALYRDASHFNSYSGLKDSLTTIQTQRMFAVIESENGNHRSALAILENSFSLAQQMRKWQPHVYYDYLNSLAVELYEVDRLEEAGNVSQAVLASPFAYAYPEWRETFDEIAAKQRSASRSIVAVSRCGEQVFNVSSPQSVRTHEASQQTATPNKVLQLPTPGRVDNVESRDQQSQKNKGRVLNFQKWKTMMKEPTTPLPKKLTPQEREEMTTGEKLIRLMDLVSRDETDDQTIDRILAAVEEIVLGRKSDIS